MLALYLLVKQILMNLRWGQAPKIRRLGQPRIRLTLRVFLADQVAEAQRLSAQVSQLRHSAVTLVEVFVSQRHCVA
jgi:hypothetical protein